MALLLPEDDPMPDDHQNDDEDAEEEEYDNQAMHHVDPGNIRHVLSPPPTAKKDNGRTNAMICEL